MKTEGRHREERTRAPSGVHRRPHEQDPRRDSELLAAIARVAPGTDLRQGIDDIEESLRGIFTQPEQFLPIIIGGDHAITAPAVRAFCKANPDKQVGLIHFDAHNDVRVLDHGPTNGTPIRGILTSGVRVAGKNLVQVGIHGFMNASYYKRWVEGKGGTIMTARAIRRRGMEEAIHEAVEIAGRDTDAIYVTVDIDAQGTFQTGVVRVD